MHVPRQSAQSDLSSALTKLEQETEMRKAAEGELAEAKNHLLEIELRANEMKQTVTEREQLKKEILSVSWVAPYFARFRDITRPMAIKIYVDFLFSITVLRLPLIQHVCVRCRFDFERCRSIFGFFFYSLIHRDTALTQLQMVQDTNGILEQWRTHYEREIVHLQLSKAELERASRQEQTDKTDEIIAVSLRLLCCFAPFLYL